MPTLQIDHDTERHRFHAEIEGRRCLLDYRLSGTTMTITHTEVSPQLGGRGFAGQLMEAALAHARTAGWKVAPLCSYAADYMQRHPDTADLRA